MRILVTGGAGYIGSHTCLELLNQGHEVVAFDNLCNASEESLKRVREITGKELTFYQADMLDRNALEDIFPKKRSTQSSTLQASRPWANRWQSPGSITITILQGR